MRFCFDAGSANEFTLKSLSKLIVISHFLSNISFFLCFSSIDSFAGYLIQPSNERNIIEDVIFLKKQFDYIMLSLPC